MNATPEVIDRGHNQTGQVAPSASQHARIGVWDGDSLATDCLIKTCRALPRFRGKGRLFETAGSVFFGGSLTVRNATGARIQIDPLDFIGRTIAFEGGFEKRSLSLAASLLQNGGVFVDIGCNFGMYTVALGMLRDVECIAIDASFKALHRLARNLALNPSIKARIVNAALTDQAALLCFETPSDNLGGTHMATPGSAGIDQFYVSAVVLNDVLRRLNASPIKLLKIDVEGAELSVFKGLDFNGPHRPEHMIVECYTALFPQARACFDYLVAQDYEPLTVDGASIDSCDDVPEENVWFRSRRAHQPTSCSANHQ